MRTQTQIHIQINIEVRSQKNTLQEGKKKNYTCAFKFETRAFKFEEFKENVETNHKIRLTS